MADPQEMAEVLASRTDLPNAEIIAQVRRDIASADYMLDNVAPETGVDVFNILRLVQNPAEYQFDHASLLYLWRASPLFAAIHWFIARIDAVPEVGFLIPRIHHFEVCRPRAILVEMFYSTDFRPQCSVTHQIPLPTEFLVHQLNVRGVAWERHTSEVISQIRAIEQAEGVTHWFVCDENRDLQRNDLGGTKLYIVPWPTESVATGFQSLRYPGSSINTVPKISPWDAETDANRLQELVAEHATSTSTIQGATEQATSGVRANSAIEASIQPEEDPEASKDSDNQEEASESSDGGEEASSSESEDETERREDETERHEDSEDTSTDEEAGHADTKEVDPGLTELPELEPEHSKLEDINYKSDGDSEYDSDDEASESNSDEEDGEIASEDGLESEKEMSDDKDSHDIHQEDLPAATSVQQATDSDASAPDATEWEGFSEDDSGWETYSQTGEQSDTDSRSGSYSDSNEESAVNPTETAVKSESDHELPAQPEPQIPSWREGAYGYEPDNYYGISYGNCFAAIENDTIDWTECLDCSIDEAEAESDAMDFCHD